MSSLKDMGPMSLGQLHDALTPEWHPRDTEAHAKQINTALDSERAFRGNFRYIETKEGFNLLFRGLLQPTGPLAEHVEAMLTDTESYPGLTLHQANLQTGIVANYRKPIHPSPEIIQKGDFFYLTPLAIRMYAEFMRKYTNNPRIRAFRDNYESLLFLEALEGVTNGEKFEKASIPMPGLFNANYAKVVDEGEGAYWVSLSPYKDAFDALSISRGNHGPILFGLTFYASVPLLIEDITA